MSEHRIRVGIIGFGRIGNEHAEWISHAKGIRVVAAFDPTPARRDLAKSKGLHAVDSIHGILDDDGIHAVLVSTPTSMHFEHASRALDARKHVMVEKPAALNCADYERLMARSGSSGSVLSVFHNRRYDIDYLTVRHAIASGVLGDRVFNIESRLGQWSSCVGPATRDWRPNWRNESAFGGGGLYDWGPHFVDQMLQLMLPAKPHTVFAQLRANVWSSDPACDDFARVCIDFDNGTAALVEINTTTTRPLPRWHVDGKLGSMDSPFSLSFDTNEWAKLTFSPANGEVSRLVDRAPEGLTRTQIWEQFALACRGEGEPAVTAQSVVPTMRVLDAARESARTGDSVHVSSS